MRNWTRNDTISLGVHSLFVSIPFIAGTVSSFLLWVHLFGWQQWPIAIAIIATMEVLALTGFVLALLRISSPLIHLRHILPFISVVPLGRELYVLLQLGGNDTWVSVVVSVFLTAILTILDFYCFRAIENLFVSPQDRAQRKMREMVDTLNERLTEARITVTTLDTLVSSWQATRTPEATPTTMPAPALPDTPSDSVVVVSPNLIDTYRRILSAIEEYPTLHAPTLAAVLGVSQRTIETRRKDLIELGVLQIDGNGNYKQMKEVA